MWEEKYGSEPGLPGLSFTSKQLFWIASAQVSLFNSALMLMILSSVKIQEGKLP